MTLDARLHAAPEEVRSLSEQGLYADREHDACGVGFVAHIKGQKAHSIIEQGLKILENLDHRGAVGADKLMGDGAGILIQIPDEFYRAEMAAQGVELPPPGEYGVGMIFLPKEHASRLACVQELERAVKAEGQVLLGWRDVPVDRDMPMSPAVRAKEPVIRQIFIGRGADVIVPDALERKLYVIRKTASGAIQRLKLTHSREYYVPSMSCRTVLYKGLLLANQVGQYYRDLADPRAVSAFALVHQRFSTNTFPEWPLAHPYRMVAHNGEINTVKGNFNWMRARQGVMKSPVLGDDLKKLYPISFEHQSDTATFDNTLELLVMAGYSLAHAAMMMIPEAWEQHESMDPRRRAFYEYHAAMMEPWDGPAAMVFTDGKQIGATLDRNGLRPARYIVTDDDLVVMASESGVLPIPENRIVKKWRLQPGKMFLIDFEQGRIVDDEELKSQFAAAKPYRQWIENVRIRLDSIDAQGAPMPVDRDPARPPAGLRLHAGRPEVPDEPDGRERRRGDRLDGQRLAAGGAVEPHQAALQLLQADVRAGHEPADRPDPRSDRDVAEQLHRPEAEPARHQRAEPADAAGGDPADPRLRRHGAAARHRAPHRGQVQELRARHHLPARLGARGRRSQARVAVRRDGRRDRQRPQHPDRHRPPRGPRRRSRFRRCWRCRRSTSTWCARACAPPPAWSSRPARRARCTTSACSPAMAPKPCTPTWRWRRCSRSTRTCRATCRPTRRSPTTSRRSARACRRSCPRWACRPTCPTAARSCSRPSASRRRWSTSTSAAPPRRSAASASSRSPKRRCACTRRPSATTRCWPMLDAGGEYAWRVRGEEHMWTPDAIAKLQHSVRAGQFDTYKEYAQIINDQSKRHMTLRGLFEFRLDPAKAIPLDEVEPASEIVKRFATGAMSLGSISTEAHSTLAIAMNRIGGKSNTGEGGEDPARYRNELKGIPIKAGTTVSELLGKDVIEADYTLQDGDSLRSRIKQVASGRFGVTTEYLSSADQIQIKMAQGAKPGEGGQLPGGKVSEYIGFLRYSVPGVGLISPPPHHDIYSIEDLAQLIHDLKNANQKASISVKLVSEVGVGTIAAGVTKCKADHVVIAGHDGGTGASPWSSIKHAGTPWELGLAETQQTLVLNRLRGRIRVQADGQMKTGRDVVIGALLGADEFGFATAPLVAEGCIMMRKCHLNTCPVGVATQDPVLRRKFSGKPEHVVNYFFFVAEEARTIMAQLGIRSFDELIGRADLLDTKKGIEHWKARGLDFSRIFHQPAVPAEVARHHTEGQDHGLHKALDLKLIERCKPAIERGEKVQFMEDARNLNRSVGAMLSGELIRARPEGLPDHTIFMQMEGTGGQSFGAFLANGITLYLIGDANDYTGKGLSGGRVVVRPSIDFRGDATRNIIVGNTVLYGATRGEAFFRGVAGERFAVRLSGASAVVEGTGDHGCEYMTGGTVVVLGRTGRNFAAGMSGGIAYVYDEDGSFAERCNPAMVALDKVLPREQQDAADPTLHLGHCDEPQLKKLIEDHHKWTGSLRAREILDSWAGSRAKFVKVFPHEYKRALTERAAKAEAADVTAKAKARAHAATAK